MTAQERMERAAEKNGKARAPLPGCRCEHRPLGGALDQTKAQSGNNSDKIPL